MQRVGGHALSVFADRKHNCHMYAFSALQALFEDVSAVKFFRDEFVHKQHSGLLLFPVVMRSKHCQKQMCLIKIPTQDTKLGKNVGLH